MLEAMTLLYSYGYYGGAIGNMLARWEQAGVFSYLLPFLLIFALVFGILTQTNIFKENRPINGIIALVVGLMSLQFDFVPRFFAEIFPRVGVGLAVMLVAMIFLGMFLPDQKWVIYTFFGIGAIVLVVVLINTAGNVGWYQGYWWHDHWMEVVGIGLLFAVFGIINASTKPQNTKTLKDIAPTWIKEQFK